jgi:hypothetical protein
MLPVGPNLCACDYVLSVVTVVHSTSGVLAELYSNSSARACLHHMIFHESGAGCTDAHEHKTPSTVNEGVIDDPQHGSNSRAHMQQHLS